MTEEQRKAMKYEERQAWPVIRGLLKRKPEYAAMLLEGITRDAAVGVLQQGLKELNDMQAIARAFAEAAGAIVKATKETT
jgi:hypothetical protein